MNDYTNLPSEGGQNSQGDGYGSSGQGGNPWQYGQGGGQYGGSGSQYGGGGGQYGQNGGQYGQNGGQQQDSGYYDKRSDEPYKYNFSDYQTSSGGGGKPPKKPGRKGLVVFFSVVGSVLALVLVAFAGLGIQSLVKGGNFSVTTVEPQDRVTPAAPEGSASPQMVQSPAASGELTTEDIASKVLPSVVCITNYSNTYGISDQGTGTIMTEDGYIITNQHVVEGSTGLQVTLPSGEDFRGDIVGMDDITDLAVIKINPEGTKLVPSEFGDSSSLKVGERVIAIGNAGGSEFTGSVTSGIVSGLDRQISTSSALLKVIQTDAAINPGNSGGPLVNKFGQVIGINSAKFVKSGYEGLGFSIPINDAKPIVDDLLKNGRVTGRARLGITGNDVSEVLAQMMGIPVNGIQITGVDNTADIATKGVVPGDILTKVDGDPVRAIRELRNKIANMKPGDVVKLELYRPANGQRGGRNYTIDVKLEADNGEGGQRVQEQPQTQLPNQQLPNQGGNGQNPFGSELPGGLFDLLPFLG